MDESLIWQSCSTVWYGVKVERAKRAERVLASLAPHRVGPNTVADYTCQVYEYQRNEVKNVLLNSECIIVLE